MAEQAEDAVSATIFNLSPSLAAKLAAVVVHAEEMLSPYGHPLDTVALLAALDDDEVKAWIAAVGPLAPVKRRKP